MKTVGVIGAGQMGAGIAQVSAQAGYRVLLSDMDLARAEAGKAGIAKQLGRLVEKEKIDAGARDAALALIEPVADVSAMSPCELVIEAATEREAIKRAIFETVGKVLTVLACIFGPPAAAAAGFIGLIVWSDCFFSCGGDPDHLGGGLLIALAAALLLAGPVLAASMVRKGSWVLAAIAAPFVWVFLAWLPH